MAKSKTRKERLQEVMTPLETALETARGEVQTLKEELESWRENLPENLQDGKKAMELEEAISQLDEILDPLEEFDTDVTVEFPGMY